MKITLFSGTANPTLAGAVAAKLGLGLGSLLVDRFPDGELHVSLRESVRGLDVYLLQPASPPVAENLVELLLMADACRRSGAAHVTAVVPYLGYARQDRRVKDGEPIGARVVADAIASGGVQRLIVVDLHNPALEGFFGVPLEHLSAVSLLAEALRPMLPQRAVIVAPDLGAVRLAELYAVLLDLPAATVHKVRLSGEQVRAGRVVGDVRGRAPVIVDDMISTGGTIEATAKALATAGCLPDITVVASHALLVGRATERLKGVGIRQLIVTDSIALAENIPLPVHVVSLGPMLAGAITRLHGSF